MSSKIMCSFSAILLVLISSLPVAAQAKGSYVPPDTPEYFGQRYERFIGEKENVLRDLAKNLNENARELSDLRYQRIKLEEELAEKKQKKNNTDKTERNIAKIDKKIANLTPKIEKMKAEIEPMIADFWANHYPDPDSATPENERKQLIDERIDNIAQEIFFSDPETFGLLFRNNGSFRGDMAWVYLLHGSPGEQDNPGFKSVMSENAVHSDLMLWLYTDQEGQNVRFAFLFYRRGGGVYQLFNQDSYKMDPCGAVNEIINSRNFGYRGCGDEIYDALQQLERESASDGAPGYLYVWALFNFSQDPGITQGKALRPPPSVSEVTKQTKSRIVGEPVLLSGEEKASEFILSVHNSMIPAEFNKDEFTVSVRRKNLDWAVAIDKIKTELKVRIIIESIDDKKTKPIIFEKPLLSVQDIKASLANDPDGKITIHLLSDREIESIPSGRYTVNVYMKNILTNNSGGNVSNKYAAWLEKFVKK